MATNTIAGTIISHDRSHGSSWVGYATDLVGYAGSNYSEYNTYILKFSIPAFSGISESVTITLNMVQSSGGASITLRYALCTSDANKGDYCNTYASVSDTYQIKSGTLSLTDLATAGSYKTITIDTSGVSGDSTYYLILWAYTSTSNPNHVQFPRLDSTTPSVSVGYNNGLIYIDSGSGLEPYEVYIDNGAGWDLYIPYIDNGTGWDQCG